MAPLYMAGLVGAVIALCSALFISLVLYVCFHDKVPTSLASRLHKAGDDKSQSNPAWVVVCWPPQGVGVYVA
jgi:hypothetical protein